MEIIEIIHGLLSLAVESKASDIHIKSNKPAFFRLAGSLEAVEMESLTPDDVREFIEQTVPPEFRESWLKKRQIDYSYELPGVGRFRVNGFLQRGLPGIVMRHVSDHPPTFAELNIDATAITKAWQGYFGNITGTISLGDSSGTLWLLRRC